MKRIFSLVVLISILIITGCCNPENTSTLTVTLHPQQTSMWCWAASGEMVMDFLDTSPTQCTQANNRFGRTDCCNNPKPGPCVVGGWPEFDKYGYTFDRTSNTALTWAQVRSQIDCSNKPFAFSWHWPGGGGHMMVVTGYTTVEGTNFVNVNDPWPPNVGDQRIDTYDEYVARPGHHTHWDDFYNVTKQ